MRRFDTRQSMGQRGEPHTFFVCKDQAQERMRREASLNLWSVTKRNDAGLAIAHLDTSSPEAFGTAPDTLVSKNMGRNDGNIYAKNKGWYKLFSPLLAARNALTPGWQGCAGCMDR